MLAVPRAVLDSILSAARSEPSASGRASAESEQIEPVEILHRLSVLFKKTVYYFFLTKSAQITKQKEIKKNCLLSYHSALIAGASVKAARR